MIAIKYYNRTKGFHGLLANGFRICNGKYLPYVQSMTLTTGAVHASPTLVYKPYVRSPQTDHDEKNMKMGRPMSPHLTIIAPTLSAFTSIAQRISGALMALYASVLSFGALFLSNGVDTYISIIQSLDLSTPLLFVIKLSLTIPFTYHYFNGIRFVLWSFGKSLSKQEIRATSFKAFYLTGIFAVILAVFR